MNCKLRNRFVLAGLCIPLFVTVMFSTLLGYSTWPFLPMWMKMVIVVSSILAIIQRYRMRYLQINERLV